MNLLFQFNMRVATVILVITHLTGCASISLNKIISIESQGTSEYISHDTGEGYVQVYRAGRRLDTRKSMELQPGDEIRTSPYGAAVIKYREHGIVVLDSNTRVKIGSLEVIIGRIFADVRGLFSAYNDDVLIGVEGTQFMFEVKRDRSTRVMVKEGVVRVSSKRNKWPPVRVHSGSEIQSNRLDQNGSPRVIRAHPRELDEISKKVNRVENAPEQGYCCQDGHVNSSLSNSCKGKFYTNQNSARQGCQQGFCCKNQNVSTAIKHQCYGKFYTDRRSADNACKPPVEPLGWCCIRGYQKIRTTRAQCKGSFYKKEKQVNENCRIF